MMAFTFAQVFNPAIPEWLAGVCAWLAMLILLPKLTNVQRIQSAILISAGLLCLFWGNARGGELHLSETLSKNNTLLVLLAGVSYLKLITQPLSDTKRALPKGGRAFISTLLGTHFFSSVINLSALLIVSDRLAKNHRLNRATAVPLMRAFSSAAFWSPFFAAMGVALIYAPGASLTALMIQGIPLVAFALFYTTVEFYLKNKEEVDNYQGYPIVSSALWLPCLLVAGVIAIHEVMPDISTLLIVASLSLGLTVLVTIIWQKKNSFNLLMQYTLNDLPKMHSELSLFLSAGVLAVGLSVLLNTFSGEMPLLDFTFLLAAGLLLMIVVLAIMGVHPVISIATMGVWLEPMQTNPDILGTVFLSGWAIGVVAAPLSGLNLVLHSRYGVSAKNVFHWHYRYVISMLLVTMTLLWVYMKVAGVNT